MRSLQHKVAMLTGLLGTKDITPWEDRFVTDLAKKMEAAQGQVLSLSDKQIDVVDRMYDQHFA